MEAIINKHISFILDAAGRFRADEWIMIIFGLLLCFFGLKLFKMSVLAAGILFGGSAGYALGSSYYGVAGGVAGALLLGLVCTLLLRVFVSAGFFICGLFCGWFVSSCFTEQVLWMVIGAAFSGILSLIFKNFFIILSTALLGAFLILFIANQALPSLFYNYPSAIPVLRCLLFIAGFACQTMKFVLSHKNK